MCRSFLTVPPAVRLIALAAYMPSLAAVEASLVGTLRAIPRDVPHLVAVVARWLIRALGAVTGYMPNPVAVVTSKRNRTNVLETS